MIRAFAVGRSILYEELAAWSPRLRLDGPGTPLLDPASRPFARLLGEAGAADIVLVDLHEECLADWLLPGFGITRLPQPLGWRFGPLGRGFGAHLVGLSLELARHVSRLPQPCFVLRYRSPAVPKRLASLVTLCADAFCRVHRTAWPVTVPREAQGRARSLVIERQIYAHLLARAASPLPPSAPVRPHPRAAWFAPATLAEEAPLEYDLYRTLCLSLPYEGRADAARRLAAAHRARGDAHGARCWMEHARVLSARAAARRVRTPSSV